MKSPITQITVLEHSGDNIFVAGSTCKSYSHADNLLEALVQSNTPVATRYIDENVKYVSMRLEVRWDTKSTILFLNYKRGDEVDTAASVVNWLRGRMLTGDMSLKEVTQFMEKYDVGNHEL